MRENHYAILALNEKFLRFHLQDKHNASYFSICLGRGYANPNANLIINIRNPMIYGLKKSYCPQNLI